MRVVWRDSSAKAPKPMKYRGFEASGYNGGWVINIKGDDNIYKSHYSALNAIDEYLGGTGLRPNEKRKAKGIEIIGKKDKIS